MDDESYQKPSRWENHRDKDLCWTQILYIETNFFMSISYGAARDNTVREGDHKKNSWKMVTDLSTRQQGWKREKNHVDGSISPRKKNKRYIPWV